MGDECDANPLLFALLQSDKRRDMPVRKLERLKLVGLRLCPAVLLEVSWQRSRAPKGMLGEDGDVACCLVTLDACVDACIPDSEARRRMPDALVDGVPWLSLSEILDPHDERVATSCKH